jgi:hypothetical protein
MPFERGLRRWAGILQLARDFFARLADRYLTYFLSRQTSTKKNSLTRAGLLMEGWLGYD